MANRYIELKAEDAEQIDKLVNCIASHSHINEKVSELVKFNFEQIMILIRNENEKAMEADPWEGWDDEEEIA